MKGTKTPLTEVVRNLKICRDYSLQEERRWWQWLLKVSLPLLVLVTLMKLAGEFGYGKGYMLPWWGLGLFWVGLVAARVLVVWIYQRQRKHYTDRMAFHQQKIAEGFTCLTVENGKQVFHK